MTCGECVEEYGAVSCPPVHDGDFTIGAFLSTLEDQCKHCAAAIAMSCSTTTGGQDCGMCGPEFERNGGCPIMLSGQNLAPYFPPGCLSCVVEIGIHCSSRFGEDSAGPITLPVGADCSSCENDFAVSGGCERMDSCDDGRVTADGRCTWHTVRPMPTIIDENCLSCATQMLQFCSTMGEVEDAQCADSSHGPGGEPYEGGCVQALEDHGGCDHFLSGENPAGLLGGHCRACVAEAGMHCILRTPEPEPMRSLPDILRERGITKIFVVGLVYDFCISETAIFGMEGLGLWASDDGSHDAGITVLTDLTRPSFDGKPGAPYTDGICDGPQDPDLPGYCIEGGGTTQAFRNFKEDMVASGVIVARTANVECASSN